MINCLENKYLLTVLLLIYVGLVGWLYSSTCRWCTLCFVPLFRCGSCGSSGDLQEVSRQLRQQLWWATAALACLEPRILVLLYYYMNSVSMMVMVSHQTRWRFAEKCNCKKLLSQLNILCDMSGWNERSVTRIEAKPNHIMSTSSYVIATSTFADNRVFNTFPFIPGTWYVFYARNTCSPDSTVLVCTRHFPASTALL